MSSHTEVNWSERRLSEYFEEFAIVIWRGAPDDPASFENFESVVIGDVQKIDSRDRQLRTKDTIANLAPKDRLLIYTEGLGSSPHDNWLFGFEQCYPVFEPDPVSEMLDDLRWPSERGEMLRKYGPIFRNSDRVNFLKKAVTAEASSGDIERLLTHAVVGFRAHRPGSSLTVHLALGADEKFDRHLDFLKRNNLLAVLWAQVEEEVGYSSDSPSLADLRLWMWDRYVESAPELSTVESASFSWADGKVHHLLDLLQTNDPIRYAELAEFAERELRIESKLIEWPVEQLLSIKHIPAVDSILAGKITEEFANPDASRTNLDEVVEKRRKESAWFVGQEARFEMLRWLGRLREVMPAASPHVPTISGGLESYVSTWFRIDQAYRKLVWWFGKLPFIDVGLQELFHNAEGEYLSFVSALSGTWHPQVEKLSSWSELSGSVPSQTTFFSRCVSPHLKRWPRAVAVVISDAMRFEVAADMAERLSGSRDLDVHLAAQVAPLPSFTQLGMASLLPHRSLQLRDGGEGLVLVDGKNASGLAGRGGILATVGGAALRAEDVLDPAWDGSETAALPFIYVYHDHIDQIGDKQATEGHTPAACEEAIDQVTTIVQKLLKSGYSKVVVTADHGFLFQNSDLSDYDFVAAVPEAEESTKTNRRFVIGKGLRSDKGLRVFTSKELGLECDFDVLIPMSTQRLRRKGSGARFVHGGASLQEVVVPVVQVSSRKTKPGNLVEIALAPESSRKITTAQVIATLVQEQPVGDGWEGFESRIFVKKGEDVLSEVKSQRFSSTDAEIRRRESAISLLLAPAAAAFTGQAVQLTVEARVGSTNRWREVASFQMELVKAQERDF